MDARTFTLVLNTAGLAAAACAVAVPLGTFWAWLLTRTDLVGRRAIFGALTLMLFVPLYLQAAAWQSGFGLQGWFAVQFAAAPPLAGFWGAAWVHGMAAVPWVMLIVAVGLRLVEPELEEQAFLDGSPRQVFFRVTLPVALPAVGLAALWTTMMTATEMTVTDLFAVRTFAEEVYTEFALAPDPEAAAFGLLPAAAVTGVLLATGWWLAGRLMLARRPLSLQARRPFALGRWRKPMLVVAALLLLLLVVLPLGNLLYKAGQTVVLEGATRQRGWSLIKATEMVVSAPWRHRREIGWSVLISSLAAVAAVAAALPLAWWARHGRSRAAPALFVAAIGLAVPGPVIGLAIIALLNQPDVPLLTWLYDRTIFAPWLAVWIRCLPVAILVLWHALRSVPRELVEAATLEGAGPLGRLLWVAVPLRRPAIFSALMAALAVGFGELSASVMVRPPGVSTVAFRVFDLLHTGYEDRIAGLCLALVAIFAGIAAGAQVFLRRAVTRGEL